MPLFCPIRRLQVADLPEERIRQALIQEMIDHLGYPLGHLALETSLSRLPHLSSFSRLPKRRADLIVFGKDIHPQEPLYPLLLVECKAVPLTKKTLQQLNSYNQFVKAYFIAAVNATSFYWAPSFLLTQTFTIEEGFPSHERLLSFLACNKKS